MLIFQMIPVIMRKEIDRLMPELTPADRVRQADKESAAIIGLTSAVVAAYGMFFILPPTAPRSRHRRRLRGALGFPRLLRDLPCARLARLHTPRWPAARHRKAGVTPSAKHAVWNGEFR